MNEIDSIQLGVRFSFDSHIIPLLASNWILSKKFDNWHFLSKNELLNDINIIEQTKDIQFKPSKNLLLKFKACIIH